MHLAFSSMNTPDDPPPAELALALEQRGFESLWYGEHSHIPCCRTTPYPPGGEMPFPYRNMMDPYLSLMTAANATTTLRLGTGIALLMERDIFSQAKTIATLDRLSGGRGADFLNGGRGGNDFGNGGAGNDQCIGIESVKSSSAVPCATGRPSASRAKRQPARHSGACQRPCTIAATGAAGSRMGSTASTK